MAITSSPSTYRKQVAALLPEGGTILGILGPATDSISEQRLNGLKSTIQGNTRLLTVRGKWTEQSGYEAAAAWLRLSWRWALQMSSPI
jgi:ABC-type sugar transport system substrate-binding protein